MISVIIPTLNAAERIGPCLGGLGAGLTLLKEVIIADGGSDDAIKEIADELGARLITAPPGRGLQLGAGAKAARGDWLLFLHADTVLSGNWPEAACAHIVEHPGRAGWFQLRFDAPGRAARLVAGWATLRSRAGLPYGDQGLLISRALYDEIGGYQAIPLMEDVAIARALGRRRLAPVGATATTDAERYLRHGWARQGGRNLIRLLRYFGGASPEQLAQNYRR